VKAVVYRTPGKFEVSPVPEPQPGPGEVLFCENFYSLGINGPGGFAEFVLVQAGKCFPVGAMDPRAAVMTEPVACAVHGMDVLDLRPGSSVLVLGAGPSGLVLSQLLLHGGAARLTVAAPTKFKLDLATEFGADATVLLDRERPESALDQLRRQAPGGFDAVVDATGAARLSGLSLELVRDGGTVLVYGMADEQATILVRPYEIFRRQLTIKGSFAQTHCFERALRLLGSGRVRTDGILTHVLELGEYGRALSLLRDDPACLKAALAP
jgi:D-arabinitol dehydrogenase (NADP+)